MNIIQPKRPAVDGWTVAMWWKCPPDLAALGFPIEAWEGFGMFVLSAVEVAAAEPGAEVLGPEYHLSISKYGRRCTRDEARMVLRMFSLDDATEDNHVPFGVVRNFWRPVADHFSGYECPCVEREPEMAEDMGDFVWRGVSR